MPLQHEQRGCKKEIDPALLLAAAILEHGATVVATPKLF